ncbi:hypothetical protein [uncultured Veillonella sp.]|uniref:hypothetical protein n=1 Tax=uncultured Veillonella sp. TaxID=159268 RepID=UPI002617392D|nr:hypothetical protein [uncultured Veillonella sp.]
MKRNTQMHLKKLMMLSVLSGVIWGSASAAEPAMPPSTTPTFQQGVAVLERQQYDVRREQHDVHKQQMPNNNGRNSFTDTGEHSFTYYDRLHHNTSMAHSQLEANAAIFLHAMAPEGKKGFPPQNQLGKTPQDSYHMISPEPPPHMQGLRDYQRDSHQVQRGPHQENPQTIDCHDTAKGTPPQKAPQEPSQENYVF